MAISESAMLVKMHYNRHNQKYIVRCFMFLGCFCWCIFNANFPVTYRYQ